MDISEVENLLYAAPTKHCVGLKQNLMFELPLRSVVQI